MVSRNDKPLLERYQRLVDITLDLASTLDLGELLNRIVQAAADLSDAEAASILLYDPANQQLYFQAATNLTEPTMRGLIVPVDASIAGWIVTHRQPLIVGDAQTDPRHFSQITQMVDLETTSLLGVPLIAKTKVVGVLEAINKQSGPFTDEDQDILCALSAQAAVAIENSRLFQQSDMIAELIHELRTPLSSVNTAAHLLLRPKLPEEERIHMVEVIQEETLRLSEMAASYLDLARLESGREQYQLEIFDLNKLLDECTAFVESRAAEKQVNIHLELTPGLQKIQADRNKIKQVILNLISNALKYNHPGGSIEIQAQKAEAEIQFSIADSGAGIPAESLQHLFQKFYRAPGSENLATGTGLGLSICKHIVEDHRGRIEVQSKVGKGSTFTVYLPIKHNERRKKGTE